MPTVAVVGNLARDVVDGGAPSPGGCPSFAAETFRRLAADGQIVTRFAEADRGLFEPALEALGVPVTLLPAERSSGFSLDYEGEERLMGVTGVGATWQPADAAALAPDVRWVHVAPLLRSDFPAATLAALAAGRQLSLDGQGLVRKAQLGPLVTDADFDRGVLASVTTLKLSEEEARIVAGGSFDRASAAALGIPEVLLTLGSHGAVLFTAAGDTFVPAAWPVLGVQTTGAGDAFMVAFATSRAAGLDAVAAATRASRAVAEMLEERKHAGS